MAISCNHGAGELKECLITKITGRRGTRRRVNIATTAGEGTTAAQETERFHFHLLICLPFHDWKQQAVELLAGTRFPHMIYDDA